MPRFDPEQNDPPVTDFKILHARHKTAHPLIDQDLVDHDARVLGPQRMQHLKSDGLPAVFAGELADQFLGIDDVVDPRTFELPAVPFVMQQGEHPDIPVDRTHRQRRIHVFNIAVAEQNDRTHLFGEVDPEAADLFQTRRVQHK